MFMIRVTDLTFAYPGSYDNMFEHASFQFDTDWKLGFTGRNGRGKTTFLRLLAGELPHGGAIAGEVPCGYFPPPVKDGSRLALEVMAAACPAAEELLLSYRPTMLFVEHDGAFRRNIATRVIQL